MSPQVIPELRLTNSQTSNITMDVSKSDDEVEVENNSLGLVVYDKGGDTREGLNQFCGSIITYVFRFV